MIYDLNV